MPDIVGLCRNSHLQLQSLIPSASCEIAEPESEPKVDVDGILETQPEIFSPWGSMCTVDRVRNVRSCNNTYYSVEKELSPICSSPNQRSQRTLPT